MMSGRDRDRTCDFCRVKSSPPTGVVGGGQVQRANLQVTGAKAGGRSPIAPHPCPTGCWEIAGMSEASQWHRGDLLHAIYGHTDSITAIGALSCGSACPLYTVVDRC